VLIQLLPLSVAWFHGPDLAWLLPAVILARVVTLASLFFRCRVHVFKGFAPKVSRTLAKGLLQFGGWVTVTSLVGPMMVILDRFVIGAALGAKAVTYYTVPFQLAERSSVLPGALASALFPRLAAAGTDEARRLAAMAIRSLAVVMTPVMLVGLLLIEPFLQWWLSPEFGAQAGLTAQVLLLGFWINAFARVPYAQLQAAGLPGVVARCHMGEVVPYLLLLYVGLHFWGLPGAAVVFGLRTLADCVLLLWFAGNLAVGFSALRVPALLLSVGLGVAAGLPYGSMPWRLAALALLLLSFGWAWRSAPFEVRSLARRMVNKLRRDQREKFR
jgi:O-antigen/teichoic acid export membrane protein